MPFSENGEPAGGGGGGGDSSPDTQPGGGGGGWVPTDGDLVFGPGDIFVYAYWQGRLHHVANPEVATAIWGAGWPSLLRNVSADWLLLFRGRQITSPQVWAEIQGGQWAEPPPPIEDPEWRPPPDDLEEISWEYVGNGILDTIKHEGGVLLRAIGKGILNLVDDAQAHRVQTVRIRRDWG